MKVNSQKQEMEQLKGMLNGMNQMQVIFGKQARTTPSKQGDDAAQVLGSLKNSKLTMGITSVGSATQPSKTATNKAKTQKGIIKFKIKMKEKPQMMPNTGQYY